MNIIHEAERRAAWVVLERLESAGRPVSLGLLRNLYASARSNGHREMAGVFRRWGLIYRGLEDMRRFHERDEGAGRP